MARIALPLIVSLILAGCTSNPAVKEIPSPNFNGPTIVPQSSASTPPVRSTPARRSPQVASGVPREWVPPSGASRGWKWIIIHHSATPSGSARSFDRMHREKGWDELGYHFVIGNGTDSGNGQVEVGPRWPKQKWGAHAKTPNNEYNDFGIGICLVGNFDIERPTAQQTKSLARLIAYLMKTYNIPAARVLGHSDTKPTDCPGRNMNIAAIRRMATQMADTGDAPDDTVVAGSLIVEAESTAP
jgi:hypothetical protein